LPLMHSFAALHVMPLVFFVAHVPGDPELPVQ
jgi:hypothetical protein